MDRDARDEDDVAIGIPPPLLAVRRSAGELCDEKHNKNNYLLFHS